MAGNRYSINNQGGDWFDQNRPGNPGPMQTQSTEQGPFIPGTQPAGFTPGQSTPFNQPGATTWDAGQGWTGTSAVGGPEQFGGDMQKWFMALVGNRPWNQATLNNLMPVLSRYGVNLTPPNASGDQTKIQLPDGTWVRVGFGEGHPVWIPQSGAGASGGTGGAGSYTGPGAIPPPFQAPTLEQFQQEPGLQARYQMGLEGLQRSAAAQGSLLSGGTQKAINRYSQDFGSNEYQNSYNRALQTYQQNYLTQSADPWARYRDLYQGGLQAAATSKTPTNPFAP